MALSSPRALGSQGQPLPRVGGASPLHGARQPIVVIAGRGPSYQDNVQQTLERDGYVTLRYPELQAAATRASPASVVLIYADHARLSQTLEVLRGCQVQSIVLCGSQLSVSERVTLLDSGADDVLVLPVGERELSARVRARLRRSGTERAALPIALGKGRILDVSNCAIHANGQSQRLTPMELKLVLCLARELGQPVPLPELAASVWGLEYPLRAAREAVRALVYRLRRKLEPDPASPQLLRAVRGRGWVLGPAPHPVRERRRADTRVGPQPAHSLSTGVPAARVSGLDN